VENETLSRKLAALQSTGGTSTPGNATPIVATAASATPTMHEMLLGDVTPCSDVLDPTTDVFGDFVTD
jgi:hypothetical protein